MKKTILAMIMGGVAGGLAGAGFPSHPYIAALIAGAIVGLGIGLYGPLD